MLLKPCVGWSGDDDILESDPPVEVFDDAIYMPDGREESWGLYTSTGQVIASSLCYDRGVPLHHDLQPLPEPSRITEYAPEDVYIYGGKFKIHYGHFIIDTLSRLWPFVLLNSHREKVLFHDTSHPDYWFGKPFISSIFETLGLDAEALVVLDRPVRLRRVVVPHASFQERSRAHRVFGLLCARIGDALLAKHGASTANHPIYLSKTELSGGVRRLAVDLERGLEDRLKRAGVEITYPEKLSFVEQVKLFSSDRVIMATAGSALHTSIFSPPRSNLIVLNPGMEPSSNFSLVDKLRSNKAQYVSLTRAIQHIEGEEFLSTYVIDETKEVARDLLRLARRAGRR